MNVAIIGAGYSGMVAGVTLAAERVPVTVYEASASLGGRARRVELHGMALDNGIHLLIGAYRETLALIRKAGLDPDDVLLRAPLDWEIHERFRFRTAALPAPLHLAYGMLSLRGAPWAERWSAARFLSAMRRSGFRLEQDCPVSELLASYRQGPSLIRHLWEPLCLAALNTPLHEASARIFLNVLKDGLASERAASDLLLSRVDLGALLPEAAAKFVIRHGGVVRLREAVRAVTRESVGFRVHTAHSSDDYTHVICATSPHHAPALLASVDGLAGLRAAIEALHYEPIYTIYLQYDAAVRLRRPMLGLAGRTAQWLFDRGAIAGQHGLIAGIISAGGPHTAMPQQVLAARVHEDVRAVAGPLPAPAWSRVIAEKRATFACTVDVRRPAQVTPVTGLLLAGDYTAGDYPGTLEAAVRSGLACARAVLA